MASALTPLLASPSISLGVAIVAIVAIVRPVVITPSSGVIGMRGSASKSTTAPVATKGLVLLFIVLGP